MSIYGFTRNTWATDLDLCNNYHITQKELVEKIGLSASQLSRIVSGETKTVSSNIFMGVTDVFKVSTDYIMGLSEGLSQGL